MALQEHVARSWFTVREVAHELGVTEGRVRQFIVAKRLIGKKFGPAWAISKDELERFKALDREPGNPRFREKSG